MTVKGREGFGEPRVVSRMEDGLHPMKNHFVRGGLPHLVRTFLRMYGKLVFFYSFFSVATRLDVLEGGGGVIPGTTREKSQRRVLASTLG